MGKGTYGAVKKAIHKTSQVERAVKIIPRSKIKNWERFEMEVDILRKADHPNIIKLYEWYQDDKNVYLVTEYLIFICLIWIGSAVGENCSIG